VNGNQTSHVVVSADFQLNNNLFLKLVQLQTHRERDSLQNQNSLGLLNNPTKKKKVKRNFFTQTMSDMINKSKIES